MSKIYFGVYFWALSLQIASVLVKTEGNNFSIVTELTDKMNINIEKLIETGTIPVELRDVVKNISAIEDKEQANEAFCKSCQYIFGHVIRYRNSGADIEAMTSLFKKLCHIFAPWDTEVCDGLVHTEIETALFVLDNREGLTAQRICAIEFQNRGCMDPEEEKWTIQLPPYIQVEQTSNRQLNETSTYKVLQLTDFHYDPLYKSGSNSNCGKPLCCQESDGAPVSNASLAGYWGDYHSCDMPWHSIQQVVNEIKEKHQQFSYIYYTGDIISHKFWATSRDINSNSIKELFNLFYNSFQSIPLYPVLGNHEPNPTDSYSPLNITGPNVSTSWIFEIAAEEWSRWLPADARETILKGGYYTVLVHPGFRIIALNSNVCSVNNLWLIYNDNDPYDQLKWLVSILSEAERNGEKVHILSHIPPGDPECFVRWSHNFALIVERFSHVIAAQFNGHTHTDEFRIFYNTSNPEQPLNVAFNGGSFTTYVGLNPNFRIYQVDSSNYKVTDYDNYIFNLTEANLTPDKDPRWFKLYSFKEAYGMTTMDLQDFDNLYQRIQRDVDLALQYNRYKLKDSDYLLQSGCDDKCILENICSITAIESKNSIQCEQATSRFKNKTYSSRVH